jgi:sortase B
MRRIWKVLRLVFALCFAAVIAYSGYRIWLIQADYKKEADMHGAVMEYKPDPASDETINQNVIGLQAKYPGAVGWLTVPNTNIDYPFVQSKDNDYYLRRDLNGDYAVAGTVFMDYRCEKNFVSQNTILYGHHMKNGSMFGTLKSFNDKAFFDANRYGIICLPHDTLTLEFFAYMVITPATEKEIYNPALSDTYFDYVRQNARYYRDIGLDGGRIVTLSTCAYEFDNARMVLLAVIT